MLFLINNKITHTYTNRMNEKLRVVHFLFTKSKFVVFLIAAQMKTNIKKTEHFVEPKIKARMKHSIIRSIRKLHEIWIWIWIKRFFKLGHSDVCKNEIVSIFALSLTRILLMRRLLLLLLIQMICFLLLFLPRLTIHAYLCNTRIHIYDSAAIFKRLERQMLHIEQKKNDSC